MCSLLSIAFLFEYKTDEGICVSVFYLVDITHLYVVCSLIMTAEIVLVLDHVLHFDDFDFPQPLERR